MKEQDSTKRQRIAGKIMMALSLVGLLLHLGLNMLAVFMLQQRHAETFSEAWWQSWSTGYLAWLPFLVTGLALYLYGRWADKKKNVQRSD